MPNLEPLEFEPADFEGAEFEPITDQPDPLGDVEYTGDPEKDSAEELKAVKGTFALKLEAEHRRQLKATDSEYWICLCFQSREQVEEFMRLSGWGTEDDKYIDGQKVAAKIGIPITAEIVGFGKVKVDPKFAALSVELP